MTTCWVIILWRPLPPGMSSLAFGGMDQTINKMCGCTHFHTRGILFTYLFIYFINFYIEQNGKAFLTFVFISHRTNYDHSLKNERFITLLAQVKVHQITFATFSPLEWSMFGLMQSDIDYLQLVKYIETSERIVMAEKRKRPPSFKASAHSFKQFTSRLLKSTFSLSLYIYNSDGRHAWFHLHGASRPARSASEATKYKMKNFLSTVGLEPTTLRFKVWCSTDWASRAWWMLSI